MSEGCCQAAAITDTVTASICTLVQQEKHDLLAKPSVLLLWSHVGVTSVGIQPQWVVHSRVRECGLEMLEKKNRDTKKKRQRSRARSTTQ